ncbi:Uncharacterised protein [uncultured archaeon]|nr:Uncharacterised protein [uncultured archaeon]
MNGKSVFNKEVWILIYSLFASFALISLGIFLS